VPHPISLSTQNNAVLFSVHHHHFNHGSPLPKPSHSHNYHNFQAASINQAAAMIIITSQLQLQIKSSDSTRAQSNNQPTITNPQITSTVALPSSKPTSPCSPAQPAPSLLSVSILTAGLLCSPLPEPVLVDHHKTAAFLSRAAAGFSTAASVHRTSQPWRLSPRRTNSYIDHIQTPWSPLLRRRRCYSRSTVSVLTCTAVRAHCLLTAVSSSLSLELSLKMRRRRFKKKER
jgi:hypothetical protein